MEREGIDLGDEKSVKKESERKRVARDLELDDLRSVLKTDAGRRVIWRLLTKCRTFESVFEQSSKIYYNAGAQDLGHFIMSEIVEANEDFLLIMMKEAKANSKVKEKEK